MYKFVRHERHVNVQPQRCQFCNFAVKAVYCVISHIYIQVYFLECLQLCTHLDLYSWSLQVSLTVLSFFVELQCSNSPHVPFVFLTGKVESVTFEQSSAQVVNKGTEELRINCSHDGNSLQVMLWYQHKQSDQAMSLIGYTVLMGEPNYESQFTDRFEIKRNNTVKGSLIIKNVNLSDSAVYFCAASTQ